MTVTYTPRRCPCGRPATQWHDPEGSPYEPTHCDTCRTPCDACGWYYAEDADVTLELEWMVEGRRDPPAPSLDWNGKGV